MAKTLYEILEVHPNASVEAIQASYARLMAKFDLAGAVTRPGADTQTQLIAVREAYAILNEPNKRRKYDATNSSAAHSMSVPAISTASTSYDMVEESG